MSRIWPAGPPEEVDMVARMGVRVRSAAVVPALLLGSALVAAAALEGHEGRLIESAVVGGVLGVVAALLLVLEQLHPAIPEWRDGWRQLPTDLLHAVVSASLGGAVARAALASAVSGLADGGLGWWPRDWPLLAQLPFAVVIWDLGMYTLHRASHRVPLLWRLHAVHHSARRMYVGTISRVHPVYVALSVVCATGPLLLLGAPPALFALVSTFVGVAGMVQHSNAAIDPRPWRWLLATSDAHRWHHAVDGGGRNFGNTFSWWDRMFGTWHVPEGAPDVLGTGVADYPEGWLGQLAEPFRSR